jgi:hypothetical protein
MNALASTALFLEKRFGEILIASGGEGSRELFPFGSHVMIDSLFSTNNIKFIHDAAYVTRLRKIAYVSQFDVACENLHVCWFDRSHINCCQCNKCLRTLMTIDLLGAKNRFKTFDFNKYSLSNVKRVYIDSYSNYCFNKEIRDAAFKKGRKDIARVVNISLMRSRRQNKIINILKKIEERFKKQRFFWRLQGVPRQMIQLVLRRSIYDK